MTGPFAPPDPDTNRRRIIGQLERIVAARPDVEVEPALTWRQDGEHDYLYRRDALLILEDDVQRLRQVQALPDGRHEDIGGIIRLTAYRDPRPVPELVAALNGEHGTRVAPDHVLHIAPVYSVCPAVEPLQPAVIRTPGESPWQPVPAVVAAQRGAAVAVHIVDTGLNAAAASAHAWMARVTGDREVSLGPDGKIKEYAGHGTFTAGVLAAAAPNADIHVTGGLDVDLAATAFESDVYHDLWMMLTGDSPPAVVLVNAGFTTGGPFADNTVASEPITFSRLGAIVSGLTGTVVIAPAGNYGNVREFWPAACPWVIGVGALDEAEDRRYRWSNYGDWVNVYTRGIHLNAFLTGEYDTKEPQTPAGKTRSFGGMAVWAGTSFAGPVVAGRIAQWASEAGISTIEAWQRLRATVAFANPPSGHPTIPTDHDVVPTFP